MPRATSGRQLRNVIAIEQLREALTPDAAGHIDESDDENWECYCQAAAKIVPVGSREFFGADQVQANVTHQITVRHCSEAEAITTAHRVRFGTRVFNVASPPVDPDDLRASLVFNAIEVK